MLCIAHSDSVYSQLHSPHAVMKYYSYTAHSDNCNNRQAKMKLFIKTISHRINMFTRIQYHLL